MSASKKVIPILVDCTQRGAHQNLLSTYQVRSLPTLLFIGPGGDELGKPSKRDADTLIHLMDQLGEQGPGSGSKWPALVVLIAILIAVPCILVLVYKKWFAGQAEES